MNIIQKGLAVAAITLFIGIAIAPSINANVNREALVEFTTEVCGLNGEKQTVKLTQQEAEEIEALFEYIRKRLNATETSEEADEIFKEAVVELDKYGLLGGLSVKQAQGLVTAGNQVLKLVIPLERISNKRNNMINSNSLCLTFGLSDNGEFLGIPFFILVVILASLNLSVESYLTIAALLFLPLLIRLIIPWCFLNTFALNKSDVLTIGINGVKTMGSSKTITFGFGFTGLKIFYPDEDEVFRWYHIFLGVSLYVVELD